MKSFLGSGYQSNEGHFWWNLSSGPLSKTIPGSSFGILRCKTTQFQNIILYKIFFQSSFPLFLLVEWIVGVHCAMHSFGSYPWPLHCGAQFWILPFGLWRAVCDAKFWMFGEVLWHALRDGAQQPSFVPAQFWIVPFPTSLCCCFFRQVCIFSVCPLKSVAEHSVSSLEGM